jgi:3-oxoacyl-[acyl-carrier protein] reductase
VGCFDKVTRKGRILRLSEKMAKITFDFSDAGVVVTGAARGIGLKIASDFLESGARVSLWDCDEKSLSAAQDSLKAYQDRVDFRCVDISSFESCAKAASEVPFSLKVLVNNAGITQDKTFFKMSVAAFSQVIATNLTGTFHVTKALAERMGKGFRIINISSVVALYGNFGQTNYAAAKAGLLGMTKTLAKELGPKGITINAVCPGFIATDMSRAVPAAILEELKDKTPVRRLGEPEDISRACLFLATEGSSFINGSILSIDGGLTF